MPIQVFEDPVVCHLGLIPVTESMVTSLVTSIVVLTGAWALRRRAAHDNASSAFAVASMVVEWWDANVAEIVGKPAPVVASLTGSLFLFIAVSNLAGQLPGVHPATASIATTAALAGIVFFAVPISGIFAKGLRGYLRHYFVPSPIMAPLHLISELSRTLALCMRLFGNVMSGHLVVALMVVLAGFLVPMPMMALDVLIGLLQAYIFAILATVYIGAAIGAGEE